MRARVGWVAAVCTLAFAAPAQAQAPYVALGAYTDGVAPIVRAVAWSASGTIDVYRCSGGACDAQPLPVESQQRDGSRLIVTADLSSAQPGDEFDARLTEGGEVVSSNRTTVWTGPIINHQLAAVTGELHVGGTVVIAPSVWDGGWAGWSYRADRLLACKDANATDGCWGLGPDTTLALEPRWEGYYLFAISTFDSSNVSGDAIELPIPFPLPAPTRSRKSVVSAAYGPVAAAAVPAPPIGQVKVFKDPVLPSASLRARALRRDGKLSLGHVTCPARCKVKLTVSGGGKTLRRSFTLTGTKALTIPRRHGRMKVTVAVDGKQLATRRVRAT